MASPKQMGHRNLTMLIRHYGLWINPGELTQETLGSIGCSQNLVKSTPP